MLTQDVRNSLLDIADLNQLKSELNRLPAVDVGDYITELPPERRAIAFRLPGKTGCVKAPCGHAGAECLRGKIQGGLAVGLLPPPTLRPKVVPGGEASPPDTPPQNLLDETRHGRN